MANTVTELLERDRDTLYAKLKEAGTPARAIPVLESETDRLMTAAAEVISDEDVRRRCADLMRTLRMAVRLLDSFGEVRSHEIHEVRAEEAVSEGKSRLRLRRRVKEMLPYLLLAAGAVLLVGGMAVSGIFSLSRLLELPLALLLLIAGGTCLFLAGRHTERREAGLRKKTLSYEVRLDADQLLRAYRAALLVVDECLREAEGEALLMKRKEGERREAEADGSGLTLFFALLDAGYSGDMLLVNERMEDLKYYLHSQNIEVLDYSAENSRYFDLLPSSRKGTIRPAMKSGDRLLRRGTAGI